MGFLSVFRIVAGEVAPLGMIWMSFSRPLEGNPQEGFVRSVCGVFC